MRTSVFFLILSLVYFSCEKETDKVLADEQGFTSGMVGVDFVTNASLKSTFDLVNKFQLEIGYTNTINYTSNLPADSMDYIMEVLKTKSYLNDDRWHAVRDGDVYIDFNTGKINIVISLMNMDETNRNDWETTAVTLKLEEVLLAKSFYLKVPEGKEIYWRDKLRNENIVSSAYVIYIRSNNV